MIINYRYIAQLFPAVYILFYLLRFSFDESVAALFAILLGLLGALSALMFFRLSGKSGQITILWFFFLAALVGFFNAIFSANEIYISLFQSLAYSCVSLVLFIARLNLRLYKSCILILCAYFIFHMAIGSNPNDIFLTSQNFVSIILISCLCLYYIACIQNGEVPEIYFCLTVFVLCVWAGGRSGVLSSAVLVLATIFLIRKRNFSWLITAVAFCVFVYMAISNVDVLNNFYGLERFIRLGFSDVRDEINSAYIGSAFSTLNGFLFGVPLGSVSEINMLGGNPHNSYIRLHVQYGAIGFLLLLGILGCGMIRALVDGAYIFLTIILASMLRISSDIAAFHGPLDVVLYYGVFAVLQKNIGKK